MVVFFSLSFTVTVLSKSPISFQLVWMSGAWHGFLAGCLHSSCVKEKHSFALYLL